MASSCKNFELPTCEFFELLGYCPDKNCPLSHKEAAQPAQPDVTTLLEALAMPDVTTLLEVAAMPEVAAQPAPAAPPEVAAMPEVAAQPAPPCRFFNSPRGCRNGAGCRFEHVTVAQPEVPAQPARPFVRARDAASLKLLPAELQHLPCPLWKPLCSECIANGNTRGCGSDTCGCSHYNRFGCGWKDDFTDTYWPYIHPGQVDVFMPVFDACGAGRLCVDARCTRKHVIPPQLVHPYYLKKLNILTTVVSDACMRVAAGSQDPIDLALADLGYNTQVEAATAHDFNIAHSQHLRAGGQQFSRGGGVPTHELVQEILRNGGTASGCWHCDNGCCDGRCRSG